MKAKTAKRNYSGLPGVSVEGRVKLKPADIAKGVKGYDDWHWYSGRGKDDAAPSVKVVDWQDPDMPRMLIECGRLVRMHVRAPKPAGKKGHPRAERDTMIELSQSVSADSHIAYDPEHPRQRLYLLIDPKARVTLRQQFWDKNAMSSMSLNALGRIAGGKHGVMGDYPNVQVKPIGVLTAVVYSTDKKSDGPSYYIHQVAEISFSYPILAVDKDGRLWISGGSYTSPTAGISD